MIGLDVLFESIREEGSLIDIDNIRLRTDRISNGDVRISISAQALATVEDNK